MKEDVKTPRFYFPVSKCYNREVCVRVYYSCSRGSSKGFSIRVLARRQNLQIFVTHNSGFWWNAVLMHTGYYTPMTIPPPRSVSELQATIRILPPQESVVLTSPAHLILLHFGQYSVAKPVWSSVTHDKIHCELLLLCILPTSLSVVCSLQQCHIGRSLSFD
jgi:hypothetical protein